MGSPLFPALTNVHLDVNDDVLSIMQGMLGLKRKINVFGFAMQWTLTIAEQAQISDNNDKLTKLYPATPYPLAPRKLTSPMSSWTQRDTALDLSRSIHILLGTSRHSIEATPTCHR